jgi:tagatose-6-phosphate ketose/aldose isomerase
MVDDRCLVVALIDDAPGSTSLPYELDLLQELRQKGQGQALLTVSNEATPEIASLATATIAWRPTGACLPLALRPIADVVVGQLLGLFASMKLGLKPDRPSPSGIINRVVQGVRIYDPDGLAQGQVREWKPRPASE